MCKHSNRYSKEASDIILLKKSLSVVFNGVIEGRKVYGNIIKYMKMALSSDFGDVLVFLLQVYSYHFYHYYQFKC